MLQTYPFYPLHTFICHSKFFVFEPSKFWSEIISCCLNRKKNVTNEFFTLNCSLSYSIQLCNVASNCLKSPCILWYQVFYAQILILTIQKTSEVGYPALFFKKIHQNMTLFKPSQIKDINILLLKIPIELQKLQQIIVVSVYFF